MLDKAADKSVPLLDKAPHDEFHPHLIPHWLEPWLGIAYVFAGYLFALGSVCFLPEFEQYYLAGCYAFFVGGAIYLCTSAYDLCEVWHAKHQGAAFERAMNGIYVCGSIIYLVGTALYLPKAPAIFGHAPTELGAWSFIVGSLCFIHACFINGAHAGDVFSLTASEADNSAAMLEQMKFNVLVTTNCTMLGSSLFLVGSVLYLPTIGGSEFTSRCGTWLYIWGSVLFIVAGTLPIVNKRLRRLLGQSAPMFETVVHGTVRVKRPRVHLRAVAEAVKAMHRLA